MLIWALSRFTVNEAAESPVSLYSLQDLDEAEQESKDSLLKPIINFALVKLSRTATREKVREREKEAQSGKVH